MATIFPSNHYVPREIGELAQVQWDLTQRGFAEVVLCQNGQFGLSNNRQFSISVDNGNGYETFSVPVNGTVTNRTKLLNEINANANFINLDDVAFSLDNEGIAIRATKGVRITDVDSEIFTAFDIPTIEVRADDANANQLQLRSDMSDDAFELVSRPIDVPEEARHVALFSHITPGINIPGSNDSSTGGVVFITLWGNGIDNEVMTSMADLIPPVVPNGAPLDAGGDSDPLMQKERMVATALSMSGFSRLEVPPWGKKLRIIPMQTATKIMNPGIFSARVGFYR